MIPWNFIKYTYQMVSSAFSQFSVVLNEIAWDDIYNHPLICDTATLVQCVAIWSEGSTHYLMGKVAHDGGYHCFTFEEAMNQDHLFTMGQAETEVCRDLAASKPNTLYQIFGESKGFAHLFRFEWDHSNIAYLFNTVLIYSIGESE